MKSHDQDAQLVDLGDACAATRGVDIEGPVDFQTLMKIRHGGISDDD
ncbi:MAG: hypothetical protein KKA44_12730 [Alphaproteobacteria bacterium]|nr:hypothetical protein [Alphaproteobacteria bacterium]MBU1825830.1 hypothetical protein [Alphaproteobacteria bacterium]